MAQGNGMALTSVLAVFAFSLPCMCRHYRWRTLSGGNTASLLGRLITMVICRAGLYYVLIRPGFKYHLKSFQLLNCVRLSLPVAMEPIEKSPKSIWKISNSIWTQVWCEQRLSVWVFLSVFSPHEHFHSEWVRPLLSISPWLSTVIVYFDNHVWNSITRSTQHLAFSIQHPLVFRRVERPGARIRLDALRDRQRVGENAWWVR